MHGHPPTLTLPREGGGDTNAGVLGPGVLPDDVGYIVPQTKTPAGAGVLKFVRLG